LLNNNKLNNLNNKNKNNNQQAQAQLQQAAQMAQEQQANDNYQKELDRLSKEKIAIIQATGFGKVENQKTLTLMLFQMY
jgi:hypothetical protein